MGTLAIADYRTRILALLDDAGSSRYTTAQVDAALRWALVTYNDHRPDVCTYSLDTDGNGKIELPSDFDGIRITDVYLYDADIDNIRTITFYAYKTDEAWWIETTQETIPAGETLIITYAKRHIIDGLDSGAGTTIPSADEQLLVVGAAGYAQLQRTSSRLESVNVNDDTIEKMIKLGNAMLRTFTTALKPNPSAGYATLPAVPTNTF